ncbi:uracil-DNA glycosylase [Patescibacteria group bacterium]|nr:uracil-DNA glycosylase [Patescibacteria group bacterium]
MDAVAAELQEIAGQIRQCTLCRLCESRTNAVPGSGNVHADVVFIGEGPGKSEDEQGIPFCGASGRLLDTLLGSIQLSRQDVFITNVVKCRPPANRDPLPDEKDICATTYLDKQLALIQPKLIVTLGRHALGHFIPNLKISEVHGQPKRYRGQIYLALYHPAVALYNGSMRQTLQEDFYNIPRVLKKLAQEER